MSILLLTYHHDTISAAAALLPCHSLTCSILLFLFYLSTILCAFTVKCLRPLSPLLW